MQPASLATILARIDQAAAASPDGVVAFDGDGTLWSGDIGDDLLAALIERDAFLDVTHPLLINEARSFGIATSSVPSEIARALATAYVDGRYPEEHMIELTAWGLAGRSHDEVLAFARDVITSRKLGERMQNETVRVVEHVTRLGLAVRIVSASPRAIVSSAAALLGIDDADVIAATAVYESGRMTTRLERPVPYAHGKVTGLRHAIGTRPLLAAFGDNDFDADMLRAAAVPVAIRPKERLRRVAERVPGLVELQAL